MQHDQSTSRRWSRRIAGTCVATLILAGQSSVFAEAQSLKDGARRAGQAAGSVVHDIGQGARKVGKEIGQGARQAGQEIGGAAKEGGKEFRRAVKGQ